MMQTVVERGHGHRRRAAPGIDVAGKTGTAEVGCNGANGRADLVHRLRAGRRAAGRGGRDGRTCSGGQGGDDRRADRQVRHGGAAAKWLSSMRRATVVDGRYRVLERVGSGRDGGRLLRRGSPARAQGRAEAPARRFAEDDEFVERFRREASSAAGLQHPNVVGVYDRGEWDGTYYIAMEYLPGPHAQGAHPRRGAARRRCAPSTSPSRSSRRALRAPPRRHPPRPQAAQRDRRRRGSRQGHGLRHRPRRAPRT